MTRPPDPAGIDAALHLLRRGRLARAAALVPHLLRRAVQRMRRRAEPPAAPPPVPVPTPPPVADGRFLEASFEAEAGRRDYKLYVPARLPDGPRPLVVMLHGCTQSPDDFAAGTGMNRLAEEHGLLVAYPAQAERANGSKCWNWFNPADQRRETGEPSLIAGITRRVMGEHVVDPARVYVAGLSAGGAAAAIMGATHPDLYAAIGVHSGLPWAAASGVPSAFAAMRRGVSALRPLPHLGDDRRVPPVIVFHGGADSTVNPVNGDRVIEQFRNAYGALTTENADGRTEGGRAWTRTLYRTDEGRIVLEQWVVHDGGHAWFGGHGAGSYTDPAGPDASREMLRFFLAHSRANIH